ncbi:hypothetical protein [Micromonospora sp. S-DT3-3-22]|uniref:hypothetical protein n=1 Tax=Micromonospora sp. S-DT3-3-22 TaxID=2755359 RepID=UPI00188EADF3|nr:hypothetical protein [Micromonospora sp. S-DT3-3-22]
MPTQRLTTIVRLAVDAAIRIGSTDRGDRAGMVADVLISLDPEYPALVTGVLDRLPDLYQDVAEALHERTNALSRGTR